MDIKINHQSSVPLYLQIEEQLREEIKKQEYREGKKLPNEVALSRDLGVSRMTLRQAINKMVTDGLLVRRKGIGTVVADTSIASRINNWLSFSQEMKTLGVKVKEYELKILRGMPDESVLRFFHLKEKTPVMRIDRLRGDEEKPFVFFISYLNPKIELTHREDFSRPLYSILEDYGFVVKLAKEEISSIPADRNLARKLRVRTKTPILRRLRYVYDVDGRPVELNIGYYRGDSFIYKVESERDI